MPPELKVVPLREDCVSLTDIPAMLRKLADEIESGDVADVTGAFCLIPRSRDYLLLYGWGDVEGRNEPIIQLDLAKTFLLTHLVARS